jgi:hypothetical protein
MSHSGSKYFSVSKKINNKEINKGKFVMFNSNILLTFSSIIEEKIIQFYIQAEI